MRRLILIIFSTFALLASPALAKDAGGQMWIVSQLSGDARVVRNGVQPASLKVNARLAPGDMILTGASGRATLARGADYIVIAPRSELRLPATPQPAGFTRVIQNLGTMLFKVRHTGVPHFAVDTPMLAAVVKGTTFTVIVDKNRSAVQVIEGAVEVAAVDGGMKRLVEGGRTVFIDHKNPKALLDADLHSPQPASSSSSGVKVSSSASPSLAAVVKLTGGLVRAGANPQPTQGVTAPRLTLTAPALAAPTTGNPPVTSPGLTDPVVDIVDGTVPSVTDPVVDIVDGTLPDVSEPVVDVVDGMLPGITEPIVDVVETVPSVTEPIVDVVETVPTVVEPVVDVVETVPTVIEPIVDVVETVPTVIEPIADVVETVPAVVEPVVDVVETVPTVVEPVVDVVETIPTVTQPIVETVPTVTEPVLDIIKTVPTVTEPLLKLPSLGL